MGWTERQLQVWLNLCIDIRADEMEVAQLEQLAMARYLAMATWNPEGLNMLTKGKVVHPSTKMSPEQIAEVLKRSEEISARVKHSSHKESRVH